MDDYKDIKELLKPRRDIKASAELHLKVRNALEKEERKPFVRNLWLGGIGLGAVAAVLLILLVPSGISAKDILAETIKAFGQAENFEMLVEIRTRPVENFRYIDLNEEFVTHHIEVAGPESLLRWRVDKGERVATGRGRDIYTWIPSLKLGLHLAGTDKETVLGYLASLLTPRKILETERNNCIRGDGSKYKVSRHEDEIILTVHAGPHGNFDNPYLLNTSITESENVRRYVFDADSKRLKRASVSVISGDREITVLKLAAINYGHPTNNICRLDGGIRFIETDNQPSGLKGLSPEEAASTILNAFADWDTSILNKVMLPEISDKTYREKFKGAKLISIGRSFTSGAGNSIFVPYTLQLRDGTTQRHNIALQKTDSDGWLVAGGL